VLPGSSLKKEGSTLPLLFQRKKGFFTIEEGDKSSSFPKEGGRRGGRTANGSFTLQKNRFSSNGRGKGKKGNLSYRKKKRKVARGGGKNSRLKERTGLLRGGVHL